MAANEIKDLNRLYPFPIMRRLRALSAGKRARKKLLYFSAFAVLALIFAFSLKDPLFDVFYSPALYDREGRLLGARVAFDGQWRFPPAGTLNEKFIAAIIEAEDRRFFSHLGIDPLAIARAAFQNITERRVVSGASTLTMQCIRLSRASPRRTLLEKCVEAVLALRLEIATTKQEILGLYAANAPFGGNVVGLEAAAWRWFGRSAEELSWAEAATLAVLPNSPSLIHPGRNRNALREKRDALLRKLFAERYIDEETLLLSLREELPQEPLPLPRLAPHLLARLVTEMGGVGAFKNQSVFTTTLDGDIQERAEAILNRASLRFAENGVMNGACLIINTATGETAAYVGNTATTYAGDVDIIVSRRSSGSLLKPFLYAAMLDSGDILPSSLVSDIPTRVGSYSPENITQNYLGVVPADEALARSLNVPAARSLRVYGVPRFTSLLRGLGLSTLFRPAEEYGLPLILGGAEVTLWEITGLYAGLGRAVHAFPTAEQNRVFFNPVLFSEEPTGKTAAKGKAPLISAGAAWLTLEALVSGVRPGEESRWQEYAGARNIAWKTGTSFGSRDAWAIGLTPEWTVGVWIGNASGEGRAELRSATTAAPVLFELFSALDSLGGKRGIWFGQPAALLKQTEVCAFSGFPAGADCTVLKTTHFPAGAPAGRSCPYCRTVVLNKAQDRRIALDSGVARETVEKKRFVLPPAEEWYYRRWNLDYNPLPPVESPEPGETILTLFNPEPGGEVYIPRELEGAKGKLVFSAAIRGGGVIYWHLDENYLGFTSSYHEMEARPEPGPHTLTLVDSLGNTLTRHFMVLDK